MNWGKVVKISFLVAFFLVFSHIANAGDLSPSASPAATMYTLEDIYNRLNTNTSAVEASHDFSPSASPASSMYTLKQVYEKIPAILANTVKLGTTYLGVDGTLTPDGGTAAVADLFNAKTAHLTADWNLDTGVLNLACNTNTFNGTANKVANAYDGDGDGTNRWCIKETGNAAATDILSGKIAWVDGAEVTGSIANCSSEGGQNCFATATYYAGTSKTPDNSTVSQVAGYYPAFNLSTSDSDLTAANIAASVNIFNVTGTLLKNLFAGSAGSNVADYASYTQALGGVDDYNNNGTIPANAYQGSWTTCVSGAYDAVTNPGGNYCNTGDSNANKKDNSTGLVWSSNMYSSAARTWFVANNCVAPAQDTDCDANGEDACICVKNGAGSKTGCESLGDLGWRLPYQKELMQAYIDGSWANLTSPGYNFWSSTTNSTATQFAWYTNLSYGYTTCTTKTNAASYRARCVR